MKNNIHNILNNTQFRSRNSIFYLLFCLICIPFIIFISLSGNTFRGSDQYWYMADVERIINGQSLVTNNLYPSQILTEEPLEQSPFIHNILPIYLVALFAKILGVFYGWIFTNALTSIATAFIIGIILKRMFDTTIGILGAGLYLFWPLTLWQSTQPLAEAIIAMFSGLFMLFYIYAKTKKYFWFILPVIVGLAYWSRPTFFIIVVLLPFLFILDYPKVSYQNIFYFTFILLLLSAFFFTKPLLFPAPRTMGLKNIIWSGIPGVTDNMYSYYGIEIKDFKIHHLLLKISSNFLQQIRPATDFHHISYQIFNIAAMVTVWGFFKTKEVLAKRMINVGIVFLIMHFLTIVLFQNQARYLLISAPPLFASAVYVLTQSMLIKKKHKIFVPAVTIILSVFLVTDFFVSNYNSAISKQEKKLRNKLEIFFDCIPSNHNVIYQTSPGSFQRIGYVLRPRYTVYVKNDYKDYTYYKIKERTNAQWIFCPKDSRLTKIFETKETIQGMSPYDDYLLMRLNEN